MSAIWHALVYQSGYGRSDLWMSRWWDFLFYLPVGNAYILSDGNRLESCLSKISCRNPIPHSPHDLPWVHLDHLSSLDRRSISHDLYQSWRRILGDFLLTSLIEAIILYFLTNRLLLSPSSQSAIENRVEITYAFDVAVNSFFPAFLTVGIALLPLVTVVIRENWVCLFFGK